MGLLLTPERYKDRSPYDELFKELHVELPCTIIKLRLLLESTFIYISINAEIFY